MIASLPMYERPENRDAHDRYWQEIRKALGFGPRHLSRGGDPWQDWRSPDLLLSQTCGMPFRNHLHGHVRLIGTPDYGLCKKPGHYFSYILVRKGDENVLENYTDRTFAFNEPGSQSGWAAPQNHALAQGFHFANVLETGAHLQSAAAVASGRADICAIDAVSFELAKDVDPIMTELQIIAQTSPTPGLPYITANTQDATALFSACSHAIENLPRPDKKKLRLKRIVQLCDEDYLQIANPAILPPV